jgi:membrane-associated protease RseP (regulator of RpoE activity)
MTLKSTTLLTALLLVLSLGAPLIGGIPALACDDPHAVTVIAAGAETPPRAPRAPRPVRVPRAAVTPEAPEAAEPPEIPEPIAMVTPRGWSGFGFQCGECFVRTGPGDTAAVWEFRSLPKVYSVDLGGPAARAGIRRGDVIVKIDDLSILSPDGGRRFGAIRPGQTVKWTVKREGAIRHVIARAVEKPDRRERVELRDLRVELGRLNELSDLDELRRELATLNREMESRRKQEVARERVRVKTQPARRLRYAGVIGDTEVEVRGTGSVIVNTNDDKDELVINTGETVVRIRVPGGLLKRSGEKPK